MPGSKAEDRKSAGGQLRGKTRLKKNPSKPRTNLKDSKTCTVWVIIRKAIWATPVTITNIQ